MNIYNADCSHPNANILNDNPFVCVIDDYLSPKLCEHLIKLASPLIGPSSVVEGSKTVESTTRTNQVTFLLHGSDTLVDGLVSEIAEMIKIPKSHSESLQVINYQVGQRYDPHFDTFNPSALGETVFLEKSGQRLFTALLYLVDVEAGGETNFPNLGFEVKPKKGRIVIFQTCENGTNTPAEQSLHGSMPVIKGEKWACNLWFREKPFIG